MKKAKGNEKIGIFPEEAVIRETGEWWHDPWWLADDWPASKTITNAQLVNSVEYLKTIFDAAWAKRFPKVYIHNIFLRTILFRKGTIERAMIVEFADVLRLFSGTKGVADVIRRLKGDDGSEAAFMELQIAKYFHGHGCNVEFFIEKSKNGKRPDLCIWKGDFNFSVECKNLKYGKDFGFLDQLKRRVSTSFFDLFHSKGVTAKFVISSDFTDKLIEKQNEEQLIEKVTSELTRELTGEIDWMLIKDIWPTWLWTGDWGHGYFNKSNEQTKSSIVSSGLPDYRLIRRMLSNGLNVAKGQIEGGGLPGLIVLHLNDIPTIEGLITVARDFFGRPENTEAKVLGILLIPFYGYFTKDKAYLLKNKNLESIWNANELDDIFIGYDPVVIV